MSRLRRLARRVWDSEYTTYVVLYLGGVLAGAEPWQSMFGVLALRALIAIRDEIRTEDQPPPTVTIHIGGRGEGEDGR